ncbi:MULTISPECIES: TetR/AcrR family transcriptional regulator [unclassified Roseovarius]|uniref:TetR/AcrR family transcriptional regulator n=1 Tax=unclassified Roseovarius TaxID=2614913 RepID=UPI00273E06EE|nr:MULTISPECIES: TetR/AcrR family transcriptional regulator [unclassified Roseovarius]
MSDTRTQILDLAERAVRLRGYHAVSFRDLADELGIKSASIHYHFRHKEDLGLALVDRYAERIGASLGAPGDHPWPDALAMFCQVYRDALQKSDLQCLCGMLAAESPGLPDRINARVSRFFRENLDWLVACMPKDFPDKDEAALAIQCQLQGAMTVAVSLQDPGILDTASARICAEASVDA